MKPAYQTLPHPICPLRGVGPIGYNWFVVSPPRSKKHDEAASAKDVAERAARVAAMLDRWEAEDISGEPDWNVDELQPMTLRPTPNESKPKT
jgi:hypothetical protein